MVVPVMLLAALPQARQRGAAKAENEGTRDRDESVESRRTPRARSRVPSPLPRPGPVTSRESRRVSGRRPRQPCAAVSRERDAFRSFTAARAARPVACTGTTVRLSSSGRAV